MVEDILVTLDSWEHPTNFIIFSPKATLGGYPIIIGRPWLAKEDAYVGCKFCKMAISYGKNVKKPNLYAPT